MPAIAPAPTAAEESKNVRRDESIVGRFVFSAGFALWGLLMAGRPFLDK
jgi:hypothetical protein